ncbi:MAG: hypothetical protein NTU53_05235 [Planctomycetota bacterium]|nr:hypothetical protein [Planctomycetota bacterium]
MLRLAPLVAVVLVFASICRASDWAIPNVLVAAEGSTAIVIATITAASPVPGEAVGGVKYLDVKIKVDELLFGSAPAEIHVPKFDAGDPQGMTSPFPPLAAPPVGQKLLLFLNSTNNEFAVLVRYNIKSDAACNVFIQGEEISAYPLASIRATLAQFGLLRSAIQTAAATKSPALAQAAARTALCSEYAEIIWYGAREFQKSPIPAGLADELRAALARTKANTPAARLLQGALRKAAANTQ